MKIYYRAWVFSPLALEFAHIQLWNKGVLPIKMRKIEVSSGEPQGCAILLNSVPIEHPITNPLFGAGSATGISLDNSASVLGEFRAAFHSTQLEGGQLKNFNLLDALSVIPFDGELAPGRGLLVRPGNPGVFLRVGFEWEE